jgi:phage gpG-like protein
MSDNETSFNSKPLDDLLKALKSKPVTAKVGILGNKDARKDGGSNATIGAAHEFGSSKLPQRSFLRMPISEHLNKELEKAGGLDEEVIKKVIKDKDFHNYVEKMAILAVSIVQQAFDAEGWGKWPALNSNYKAWKVAYSKEGNTSSVQILTLTGQLRDSITYEIK